MTYIRHWPFRPRGSLGAGSLSSARLNSECADPRFVSRSVGGLQFIDDFRNPREGDNLELALAHHPVRDRVASPSQPMTQR